MANLDESRGGGDPDSGTAFAIGFAVALAKPVWAYRSSEATLAQRVESSGDRVRRRLLCGRLSN
ncbi:nucleoside 2-deoxyribosyltransferase [Caballeronia grimmiae]|uniref:nucleoside 2-deoxyribosyltransferase n=1 Tax=Caballeronia grimmiae TaxID=1071679 RepID=UPI0038BBBBAE